MENLIEKTNRTFLILQLVIMIILGINFLFWKPILLVAILVAFILSELLLRLRMMAKGYSKMVYDNDFWMSPVSSILKAMSSLAGKETDPIKKLDLRIRFTKVHRLYLIRLTLFFVILSVIILPNNLLGIPLSIKSSEKWISDNCDAWILLGFCLIFYYVIYIPFMLIVVTGVSFLACVIFWIACKIIHANTENALTANPEYRNIFLGVSPDQY